MPDPIHMPVLANLTPLVSQRVSLVPLPEGTVVQVLGPAERGDDLRTLAGPNFSVRENGPGQWFLVGDEPFQWASLKAKLPQGFTAVDQSHGRVRIAIEGEAVEEVLAKGTGVDLAVFEPGQAATTLIGHVASHLTRISADRFELLVMRSFAETVWADLKTMAAEHLGASHE